MRKLLLGLVAIILLLSGCGSIRYEMQEFDYFYFDTPINIKIYFTKDDNYDFEQIDKDLDELLLSQELTFSQTNPKSEMYALNSSKSFEASDDFINVLNTSIDYCKLSDKKYDPSTGRLISAWSITDKNTIPDEADLARIVDNTDCEQIQVDGNYVTIPDYMTLDLGSIAKGYASDLIKTYLKEQGVTSAIINLGGNVETVGVKPDGTPFKIAVVKPTPGDFVVENVLSITIDDQVVITSGINQRFFVGPEGTIYHHIIDATTGHQPEHDLASVTIIGKSGIDADALSTVTFLLGLDEGMDLINSMDDTEAIFITTDKKVYLSSGDIEYELLDDEYTVVGYM